LRNSLGTCRLTSIHQAESLAPSAGVNRSQPKLCRRRCHNSLAKTQETSKWSTVSSS
jgi:hypothetical protein